MSTPLLIVEELGEPSQARELRLCRALEDGILERLAGARLN